MPNDKAETPDFSNLDSFAEGSDEAGALDDADLTPQFEDLDDGLDDLLPQAEATDQPVPSDDDVTGSDTVTRSDTVTGNDTEQLDVLEQEEEAGSEEEGEESAEEKEQESFLARLGQTSPYTVMLAMALVVILIAITCLFLELKRYDFDIGAESGRPPSAAVEVVQPGLPNTTAVV